MTTVGGEKRPLEDILDRLNDLSRTSPEIDLREPPPVPAPPLAATPIVPETIPVSEPAAIIVPAEAPIAPAPVAPTGPPPVPVVAAPVASPVIDLTAPVNRSNLPAPPDPVVDPVIEPTVDPVVPPLEEEVVAERPVGMAPPPASEPVSAVLHRERARVARTLPVDSGSRYGRNGAVFAPAARPAVAPGNVPVLPVSVKNEIELVEDARTSSGPNWIRIAILVLLTIAAVAALILVVL